MTEGPVRRRSLWPREHGAYAQLGAPLAGALIAGRPTGAAALIAGGACLAFLAHESLLVALGHRGKRMRELAGARARALATAGGLAAAAAGAVGLALAPVGAALLAAVVAVPVAVLLVLARRKAEHTLAGELVACTALAGAAAPVAVACGATVAHAAASWVAWALGFAGTVIAVHRVIARSRHAAAVIDRVAAAGLVVLTAAAVVVAIDRPAAVVAAPLAAVSAVLVLRPPPATRLRAIGVALLVASLISTALLGVFAAGR